MRNKDNCPSKWRSFIKLKVPGVVLVVSAVFPCVVWPGVFNACSDTTWTDSDAMNKKGYQARPGFTLWTLKIVQTKFICSAPLQWAWKILFCSGVKCGVTYLVCACSRSFGRTAAWCGVGVASPTDVFEPKPPEPVWDGKTAEGSSCWSSCSMPAGGKLFCPPGRPAPQEADFWR